MTFVNIALYGPMRNTCMCRLVQVSQVNEDKEHTERGDRVPA